MKNRTEIDYTFDYCTGKVGYTITYISEFSRSIYRSPIIFESTEDAYHYAVIELSGK